MDDAIAAVECDMDARGFNARNAYYLAYASKCAYEDADSWSAELGLDNRVTPFRCGQFHGFVGLLPKLALVAFRGTQNVENCLTDAETPLVRCAPYPGLVHLGFSTAIEEVWAEVRELLGPASHALPIWVTGHSLGGAMATLASVRLRREGYNVRAVYTYGSPRVGDRVFRDSYDLPNYRFVNDNDLVPHLPFRWCYKHVGEFKLVDSQGRLTEEQTAWRAKKRQQAAHAKRLQRAHRGPTATQTEFHDFDWLADHHLDRYLAAIMKMLERHRRVDPAAAALVGPPLHVHRAVPAQPVVAPATPGVTPLPASHYDHQGIVISDEEFIAAFAQQPRQPYWLGVAPVKTPARP
jgi:hypothetical protein